MPVIQLDITRNYNEFLRKPIRSGKLCNYELATMVERIKFKIDEVGAKVENEALIVSITSCAPFNQKPKRLLLNRPFWVVMRQKGCHPYFLLQVNNTEFMTKK
jgi:hypothetical protein